MWHRSGKPQPFAELFFSRPGDMPTSCAFVHVSHGPIAIRQPVGPLCGAISTLAAAQVNDAVGRAGRIVVRECRTFFEKIENVHGRDTKGLMHEVRH